MSDTASIPDSKAAEGDEEKAEEKEGEDGKELVEEKTGEGDQEPTESSMTMESNASTVSQLPIAYGDWESRISVGVQVEPVERDKWTNQLDFLMTCVSMSVGFGNIYRFPYVAYSNGGGAFLIPYLVVLTIVGRPMYFFELILGQFTSVGCVKVWEMVPIMRGIGYAMCFASFCTVTFYCSIMATTIFFLLSSFSKPLPWADCDYDKYLLDGKKRKDVFCANETVHDVTFYVPVQSEPANGLIECPGLSQQYCHQTSAEFNITSGNGSNAELFFRYHVVQGYHDIDEGIGLPEWKMSLCLFICWLLIFGTLAKGATGSGKIAWFLAIFPYFILIILFGMSVSLPHATDGIYYFFVPEWKKLLEIKVWFEAVQQCFFSLGMGFGPVIVFGSYNEFNHNLMREVMVVSFMDTLTSLLAGTTIFAVLGNLADGGDISRVVTGGPNIAFISYPSVLVDFGDYPIPQIFSVLFFFMLLTLGIGSGVSFTQVVIDVLSDEFPRIRGWLATLAVCIMGFVVGLIYVTPGGPFMLLLVDTFGSGFVLYIVVLLEVITVAWIYGLRNFVNDAEFMLGIKISLVWKICWGGLIPVGLLFVLIYHLTNFGTPSIGSVPLPPKAMAAGIALSATICALIPITGAFIFATRKTHSCYKKFRASFHPSRMWGPAEPQIKADWEAFKHKVPYRYHPWRLCRKRDAKREPSIQSAEEPEVPPPPPTAESKTGSPIPLKKKPTVRSIFPGAPKLVHFR